MIAPPSEMTLQHLQKWKQQLTEKRGWNSLSNLEIWLLFSEEVGELARAIRKERSIARSRPPDHFHIEEECADVLLYLLDIANRHNVDLEKAIQKKHTINNQRELSVKEKK